MTLYPLNQPTDTTLLDVPTDILCSYHYFSNIDMAQIQSWGTRIIGDSGAFSAMSLGKPIDREEFHAWADHWKDALFWTASLDVIGDAEATHENWLAARRDGLDLVPTLHYGADPRVMDRYAGEGATFLGLGGMVPYSSEKDRLMRWCLSMHRYARDNHPQIRFHGWGISHPYLMDNLPWWSADSSGFSSCFRFGSLRLWLPNRSRFVSVDLNGRDLAKYAKPLRDFYGADWREISRSTPETRRPLGRVALKAVQLYGEWLRKRQIVSAPALLLPKLTAGVGPLTIGAMGSNFSAQGMAVTPDGRAIDAQGPLSVAAMNTATGQSQAITPDGRAIEAKGPLVIGAMGPGDGSIVSAPHSAPWPRNVGPLTVGAMGAPEMQPIKALNPTSERPPKEEEEEKPS